VPATGIVEWIVMVVTFPVVVLWRSRASEELIEPLHSQRENETSKLPATKFPKSLEDKLSCQIRPHLS
jgi:hypothetical protein